MLARLHPGDVPLDRVDLAVVAEQPERLRALPARLGVRREALVEDRPRRRPVGVGEVGVEARRAASPRRAPCTSRCGTRATRRRRRRRARRAGARDARAARRRARRTGRARAARFAACSRSPSTRARRRPSARRASRTARAPRRDTPPRRCPRATARARKHIASPAPSIPVSVGSSGSSTPAPSPVTPSAAHAPRCETAASPASARSSELARRAPARVGDEADAAGVALAGRVVRVGWLTRGWSPFAGSRTGVLPPGVLWLLAGGGGRRSPASAVWRR